MKFRKTTTIRKRTVFEKGSYPAGKGTLRGEKKQKTTGRAKV